MSEHFNNLTPAEAERLAILSEECAEVIQVIGKILRHGYQSSAPSGGPVNRELLELELGDVLCIGRLMCEEGDTSIEEIEERCTVKPSKMAKYTHHQRSPGPATMYMVGGSVEPLSPDNGTNFTLQEFYDNIGCGVIEVVYCGDGRLMVIDEEGRIKNREINEKASAIAGQSIVGAAVVCDRSQLQ